MGWLRDFFGFFGREHRFLHGPVFGGPRQYTAAPGTPQFYYEQVSGITQQEHIEVSRVWAAGGTSGRGDPAAARYALAQIRIAQQQLHLVKQNVRTTMKTMRAHGVVARQKKPANIGVAVVFGAGVARSKRAYDRQQMRLKEQQLLAPYESVIATIDQTLLGYDHKKAQIEAWLARNRGNRLGR